MLLDNEEIPYKPDGAKDEYYGDIGARDKGIYLEGAKAQLKKMVEELKKEGYVLARHKEVQGNFSQHWVLDVVGWETLDWQSLLDEVKDV
ncbi:hypothetical protein LCGC14_0827050 [marine sediment metagenome]|uniref:Uncharacterized protein n=1 Tax=marine sediment metagenome TaxID=412755 RepID=A0A0F9S1X1_9ZZZZ